MISPVLSLLLNFVAASPVNVPRDVGIYGEGQDVAIDAPGVAYHPAYKGFPSGGEGPQVNTGLQAILSNFLHPGWVPRGVNPAQCTPKEGQNPVVLIPGTSATTYMNWAYIGPALADEGLCVYGFTHNPLVIPVANTIVPGTGFYGNITDSAQALSVFVDEVLALTGAEKVDLVGHSQGAGALPFSYLKYFGGKDKVRKQVGLAPSLGTEDYGINALVSFILSKQQFHDVNSLLSTADNAASLLQQLSGSDFMTDLHSGGLAVEGVEYYNLATRYDEVLVPWQNCIFTENGKNITNIVLQDECGLDFSEHLSLPYSSNVLQIVKNILFDTKNPIKCAYEPLLSII